MEDIDAKLIPKQPSNPLASLWSELQFTLQIRKIIWDKLINRYLDTPGNENVSTAKNKATTKNRLTGQLAKNAISITTFMKGIKIVGFTRGTLIFRGWRGSNPKPIEVSCNFVISDSRIKIAESEKEIDDFFLSKAHRYAYILIHTDGRLRCDSLGITEEMYETTDAAIVWKESIQNVLENSDLDDEVQEKALSKLKELCDRMTHNYVEM